MAFYAEEIRARHDTRHERALAQLKAYQRGIDGDFSAAAAELTRMLAGERDPFLRAAGARLLAYSLTDAGLPVQALQVIRSGLRDADRSDNAAALKLGLADAGAYASRELNDLPAFIDNIEIGITATQQAHQPIDGRSLTSWLIQSPTPPAPTRRSIVRRGPTKFAPSPPSGTP